MAPPNPSPMPAVPQICLADMLIGIDQQIFHAQNFGIEQGNDELLNILADVLSNLYDARERIESQLVMVD